MTYEVQQTRWDRIIRRVSGSIGPGSRVSETISELFPVMDVERVPGELLFLGGTKLGLGGTQIVGIAKAGIQLFNPVNSGNLVTVEEVHISVGWGETQQIFLGITPTAFPIDTGLAFVRDTREGISIETVAQLRTDTSAVATLNMSIRVLANTDAIINPRNGVAVLAPGTGVSIVNTINVNVLNVTFFWRERPAEQSELQF